jgi:hypothetical protein
MIPGLSMPTGILGETIPGHLARTSQSPMSVLIYLARVASKDLANGIAWDSIQKKGGTICFRAFLVV